MDLFERHEMLRKKGYIVVVDAINQGQYGIVEKVPSGKSTGIKFTGYILNAEAESIQVVGTHSTYKEAFEETVEYLEKMEVVGYAECVGIDEE